MARDYAREYAARKARAIEREGFTGYRQKRNARAAVIAAGAKDVDGASRKYVKLPQGARQAFLKFLANENVDYLSLLRIYPELQPKHDRIPESVFWYHSGG